MIISNKEIVLASFSQFVALNPFNTVEMNKFLLFLTVAGYCAFRAARELFFPYFGWCILFIFGGKFAFKTTRCPFLFVVNMFRVYVCCFVLFRLKY